MGLIKSMLSEPLPTPQLGLIGSYGARPSIVENRCKRMGKTCFPSAYLAFRPLASAIAALETPAV